MIHKDKHPKSGAMVKVARGDLAGCDYRIEDWWDRVAGKSWMFCDGNPACLEYAMRSLDTPTDNEVLYGKVGAFGKLIHVSELALDDTA